MFKNVLKSPYALYAAALLVGGSAGKVCDQSSVDQDSSKQAGSELAPVAAEVEFIAQQSEWHSLTLPDGETYQDISALFGAEKYTDLAKLDKTDLLNFALDLQASGDNEGYQSLIIGLAGANATLAGQVACYAGANANEIGEFWAKLPANGRPEFLQEFFSSPLVRDPKSAIALTKYIQSKDLSEGDQVRFTRCLLSSGIGKVGILDWFGGMDQAKKVAALSGAAQAIRENDSQGVKNCFDNPLAIRDFIEVSAQIGDPSLGQVLADLFEDVQSWGGMTFHKMFEERLVVSDQLPAGPIRDQAQILDYKYKLEGVPADVLKDLTAQAKSGQVSAAVYTRVLQDFVRSPEYDAEHRFAAAIKYAGIDPTASSSFAKAFIAEQLTTNHHYVYKWADLADEEIKMLNTPPDGKKQADYISEQERQLRIKAAQVLKAEAVKVSQ